MVLPWEDMQQTLIEGATAISLLPVDNAITSQRGEIYIVDDNAMNRRLLRDFAHAQGYAVREFDGGSKCLDALITNGSPEVIVMDIQMPEMDGLETIRRIRAGQRRTESPIIIALTALVMPGDRELCLAAGADHYVTKPVEYREFFRDIDTLLARRVQPSEE